MAKHVIGLQRIASALRGAHEFHLGEVAILNGTALYRRKRRGPLLHFLQRLRNILVGDVHRGHFQFQPFVATQFKFRHHFEDGAEFHGLAFIEVQLVHFRLRDR